MKLINLVLATLFCSVLLFDATSVCLGQELPPGLKLVPKAEEEVEAYYLGEWRPAQVIEVRRNQALVQLEFAGALQNQTLAISQLRYPWQSEVISPVYRWSDQSGSFSVRAAVVDVDRDSGKITLYKLDDNQKVTLPISALSDLDQARIEKIIAAAPLKIQPPPPAEEFDTSQLSTTREWRSASNLANISPDPPAIAVAVPSGGAAFPTANFFDNLLSIYPIGSSAGWMAAATGAAHGFKKESFPGRLLWVTLADGKVRKVQSIANGERLLAVDPSTQRVLTLSNDSDSALNRDMALTVLSASPKTDKASPLIRWKSTSADSLPMPTKPFAEFVGGDRVIHRWADSRYVVWDYGTRQAIYEVVQESFFDAPPMISPGKRYLALPEDKQVRVISAVDGVTLAVLPLEGGRASGVAFDADGEKLAVLTRDQLAVWTLGSSAEPERVPAESVGSPFGQKLAWVDDRTLLVNGKVLFDLDQQLPIWSYRPEFGEVVDSASSSEVTQVAAGRLCYGVHLRDAAASAFVVGAVELPGDKVRETLDRVDFSEIWTLRKGLSVQLNINCGEFNSAVQAGLITSLQRAGYTVSPASPIIINAEMGRSPQRTVTYRYHDGSQPPQSVTVSPYFSKLSITKGEQTLWQASAISGSAPPHIWLQPNESLQANIDKAARPNPDFYGRVEIPERILDPRFRNGFGNSTYGKTGLTAHPIDDLPLK